MAGDQAARLHQPRLRQAGKRHHQPWTEAEGGGAAIGLAPQHGADAILQTADGDRVADSEAEARQQPGLDDGTPAPIDEGERRGEVGHPGVAPLLEGNRAIERIGLVHRLQLDQAARRSVGIGRHRPQLRRL